MTFIIAFHSHTVKLWSKIFLGIKIVVEGCRLGICGTVSVHTSTDIPAYNTATHYTQ